MTIYSGMNRVMLRELQSILHSISPFVQQFKSAGEATAGSNELELFIRADTGDVDRRRHNLPTAAGEVAALLPGEPVAAPLDIYSSSTEATGCSALLRVMLHMTLSTSPDVSAR